MTSPNESSTLVFFGTDAFSLPSLEALIRSGESIEAVVTKPDGRVGRGRAITASPIKSLAQAHDIPVHQPADRSELLGTIDGFSSGFGVVVAYGRIIPEAAIEHFSSGLVNVHPSLLPRYRGPAPIEAPILNGDAETGISLMRLDVGMDTGPVYVQETVDLSGTETKPQLHDLMAAKGGQLLAMHLDNIRTGQLLARAQSQLSKETPTVTCLITKADGIIDWIRPATTLERHIRAYLGWPGSKAMIQGMDVTITAAHAGDNLLLVGTGESGGQPGTAFKTSTGDLAVVTGHGELIIDALKPAGKTEMSGRSFLAGHHI